MLSFLEASENVSLTVLNWGFGSFPPSSSSRDLDHLTHADHVLGMQAEATLVTEAFDKVFLG